MCILVVFFTYVCHDARCRKRKEHDRYLNADYRYLRFVDCKPFCLVYFDSYWACIECWDTKKSYGAWNSHCFSLYLSLAEKESLFNLLKPTGYAKHQQFNIQQLYALPTLYLCVLYLSENKQRLVPLTA